MSATKTQGKYVTHNIINMITSTNGMGTTNVAAIEIVLRSFCQIRLITDFWFEGINGFTLIRFMQQSLANVLLLHDRVNSLFSASICSNLCSLGGAKLRRLKVMESRVVGDKNTGENA